MRDERGGGRRPCDEGFGLEPLVPLDSGSYFGRRATSWVVGPVTLTATDYAPAAQVPLHAHARAYFCYVTAGAFREVGARGSYRAARGTLVYHPSGEAHADAFDDRGGRCFNIEIDESVMRDSIAATDAKDGVCEPGPIAGRAIRYAAELYRETRAWDAASPVVVEALVAALVARATGDARLTPRGPGRERAAPARTAMTRALERLVADPCTPPSLADLAADAGMPASAFSRAFRRHHGRGVGAVLRAERVERAKRALGDSARPVSMIAADLGFADQAHLTRVFRDATGWTPAAFRRAAAA